ncbi:hypothetical protein D9M73_65150 [compost metagenome]
MNPAASKGQWFKLPSGKTAEVCGLAQVRMPMTDQDREPRFSTEVTLRFLNNDGAMAPGEFVLSLEFLLKHGVRVVVAPPVPV